MQDGSRLSCHPRRVRCAASSEGRGSRPFNRHFLTTWVPFPRRWSRLAGDDKWGCDRAAPLCKRRLRYEGKGIPAPFLTHYKPGRDFWRSQHSKACVMKSLGRWKQENPAARVNGSPISAWREPPGRLGDFVRRIKALHQISADLGGSCIGNSYLANVRASDSAAPISA